MAERPPLRVVRAGVFSSVCAAVSVGGHTFSSEHSVPVSGLLVGAVLVYALAWSATDRERGLGAIVGQMAWGQLALHLAFSVAQSAGSHGGHTDVPAAADPASGSADMLVAHLVAGTVCAWWLRQGEAALFSCLRLAATALLPVLMFTVPCVPPEPVPSAPLPARDTPVPAASYLRQSLFLRGPPAR